MKSPKEEISNLLTKQQGEVLIERMEDTKSVSSDYLEEFKRLFISKPSVVLTLAFNPDTKFVSSVKKWFEGNLGEEILLDLKVDPNIVGGIILVCNNHYKDFSIGSAISSLVLVAHKAQV
ncbi:MAG TPA: F0F1 ATP synthase subunit delta [Candidatus Saccharimonadales bacterium]|nr:F0F1 ATP synthase subunit delta [Candidatus Saccharimonadales bacterium]